MSAGHRAQRVVVAQRRETYAGIAPTAELLGQSKIIRYHEFEQCSARWKFVFRIGCCARIVTQHFHPVQPINKIVGRVHLQLDFRDASTTAGLNTVLSKTVR